MRILLAVGASDRRLPSLPDDLYLASTPDEVEPARPFLTGDIFDGIEIPGLASAGLAIVPGRTGQSRVGWRECTGSMSMIAGRNP